MRLALATLFLMVCSCALWAAQPAAPPQASPPEVASDFDRNVALGAILETRPGTQPELEELGRLAERGLKQARAAAAKSPDSAEAQYELGSWLLYGYRVVKVEQISFNPDTGARRVVVDHVKQGLTDDPTEGLSALKKATELAPKNTGYLLDYAAALIDYDRDYDAAGILKGIWAGNPPVSMQEKMRAGLLLSSVAADNGDLAGAREWVYSALSLDPNAAEAVDRLRYLDAAEAAQAQAAQAPPEEQPSEEEVAPEQPQQQQPSQEEQAPEEGYQQPQSEPESGYQEMPEPPAPPSGGPDEYVPGYPEPPTGEPPGYNEAPPGYEEGPPGEVPGYEEGPPVEEPPVEGPPTEVPGYEEGPAGEAPGYSEGTSY